MAAINATPRADPTPTPTLAPVEKPPSLEGNEAPVLAGVSGVGAEPVTAIVAVENEVLDAADDDVVTWVAI
jgi:hypothetical protein